jgi:hypothetical protein
MTELTQRSLKSRSEEHMLGHGFYNKHSHEQAKANTYGLPLITEAISHIDLAQIAASSESPITVRRRDKIHCCRSKLRSRKSSPSLRNRAARKFRFPSPTPICRRTIGPRCFKRSCFHSTVTSSASQMFFVSRAAPRFTNRFFHRTRLRSAIRPSSNIG